jgi:CheY-like chemotaxis protein
MLTDALELNGYEVTTAGSGSHALQKIAALGAPDIVVMDADLNLMSGIETISALLDLDYTGPLVLLVDPAKPIDREGLPPLDHMRFVQKPVSVQQLLRSVRGELDAMVDESSR